MIASILYIYFPELPDAHTQLDHSFRTSNPNIRAPFIYLSVDLSIYFPELPNAYTQKAGSTQLLKIAQWVALFQVFWSTILYVFILLILPLTLRNSCSVLYLLFSYTLFGFLLMCNNLIKSLNKAASVGSNIIHLPSWNVCALS